MSGFIWKANMYVVGLITQTSDIATMKNKFMELKDPNSACLNKKLVKHSLHQNSSARPIFPSQSDRLDIKKLYFVANILLILSFYIFLF